MCGLVGVAGKLSVKDEALMRRLLLVDYLRGTDSTGVAAVKGSDGSVQICKSTLNPIDFFDLKRTATVLNGYQSKAFIGHNRAATRGVVNNLNAHPFHVGSIVGAHNGTLDYSAYEALEKKLGEKYGTDSEALIASIDRFGIEETIGSVQGAWSLTWYDQEDNTMNFLRNKERPMYVAFSEDKDRIFWASAWQMIQLATDLSENKQVNHRYDLWTNEDGYQFFATKEDVWYSFPMEEFKANKPDISLEGADNGIVKAKEPVKTTPPFRQPTTNNVTSGSSGTGTANSNTGKEITTLNLISKNGHPFAGFIQEEQVAQMVKHGCGWCRGEVDITAPGLTIFEKEGVVLCPKCCNAGNGHPNAVRIITHRFSKLI